MKSRLMVSITGATAVLLALTSSAGPKAAEADPLDRRGWWVRAEAGLLSSLTFVRGRFDRGWRVHAEARRAFRGPLAVAVRLAPLGIARAERDRAQAGNKPTDVLALAAWAELEWDMPTWGVSAGLGGSTVNHRADGQEATGALLPTLGLRLGRLEGPHLRVNGGLHVFSEGAQPGMLQAMGSLPVAERGWLFLRGLASNAGALHLAVGAGLVLTDEGSAHHAAGYVGLGYGQLSWEPPAFPQEVALAADSFGGEVSIQGFTVTVGFQVGTGDGR